MKLRNRTWIVLATTSLSLAVACGPSGGVNETEGDSEDTGTSTGAGPTTNLTTPTMTTMDPSVGTGDVTGATTDPTDPTTADTTEGPVADGCCEVHDGPGCNEADVVECVCAVEATCCAFEWSETCVELAMGKCMATCEDPGETGTGDSGTTTGMGEACSEIHEIELVPSEATLSGAWTLSMSMLGEGEIAVINNPGAGTDGSILFEPEIPCDDTWYIWARARDAGQNDSYFATLDGEPMPPAVFEGDCTPGSMDDYIWAPLNWRDEADPPCTYIESPWAPDWAAGVHQIEFSFRESQAMGRILITNDQDLVPM